MAHIRHHHAGADEAHSSFLVIFKVTGSAIHIWSEDKMKTIGDTHTFRVACHHIGPNADKLGSDIQVLSLRDPAPIIDKCTFEKQQVHSGGQPVDSHDLVLFMTDPVSDAKQTSYAIDLSVASSLQQHNDISPDHNVGIERIGTAYLYLDPRFSSQGIQRTPVISNSTHLPVGQMQVEYLIITNPVAYGLAAPKPEWLFGATQLESGHRGAGSGRRTDLPHEPLLENTIASFNYAHQHGADMCELDILVSADGIPVVYHDFDVDAVTAHQSSDQLGKFRVQVNEFTLNQLRDFELLSLHDAKGHQYTLNVPNQAETNRPFPTLREVLEQVAPECGLNIEIKWPQLLESGRMEARRYREINDFVDRIISVMDEHAGDRRVVLESFDADIVIMLRMKQNRFPVVFLTQAKTDQYERYDDIRARCVYAGVYFAQAFDLAGIDLILDYYVMSGRKLVDFIQQHGLVARAWGNLSQGSTTLNFLKSIGLQCITYDKIDLLKERQQPSTTFEQQDHAAADRETMHNNDANANNFTQEQQLTALVA